MKQNRFIVARQSENFLLLVFHLILFSAKRIAVERNFFQKIRRKKIKTNIIPLYLQPLNF